MPRFRSRVIGIALACALCADAALAQAGGAQPAAHAKTFDVVSIRQNVSPGHVAQFDAPTPDGYRMTGLGVIILVLTAYAPQSSHGTMLAPNNIVGMPEWAWNDNYEVDARISDADRADWQDPKKQPEMLREMLQAMLADRFYLVAHREVREANIYSLQVAKGGPKFQETKPDEPHPGALALPGGGSARIDYATGSGTSHDYDMTMANFAARMSNIAQRTIRDDTGLTGRYDLTFQYPSRLGAPTASDSASDSAPTIFSAMQELGLKLEPAKGQIEVLAIDHIERPSEN